MTTSEQLATLAAGAGPAPARLEAIDWAQRRRLGRASAAVRAPLCGFYLLAGYLHLAFTAAFMPIMPDWVPYPVQVIEITGVCELLGAAGLLLAPVRRLSGVMLALYAVCVFPANLHHAFDHVTVPGLPNSWWYHAPRLALQPVLVWAALFAGGAVTWPWRPDTQRSAGAL